MSGGPNDPVAVLWTQLSQSWTAPMEVWAAWANTWQSVLASRGVPAAKAMLEQLADPSAWPGLMGSFVNEMQDIFSLPRLADLPGLDGAGLPSLAPAAELTGLALEYFTAMVPLWVRVCERFQVEIAERRARGEAMDSAGRAMDLWNNTLDQTMMEFNRSGDFAKLQQRFLRAAMRYRLEVRKLAERAAQVIDQPTRTEVDDIYRRLHDLTHEVHALRRELRTLRRSAPEKQRAASVSNKGA